MPQARMPKQQQCVWSDFAHSSQLLRLLRVIGVSGASQQPEPLSCIRIASRHPAFSHTMATINLGSTRTDYQRQGSPLTCSVVRVSCLKTMAVGSDLYCGCSHNAENFVMLVISMASNSVISFNNISAATRRQCQQLHTRLARSSSTHRLFRRAVTHSDLAHTFLGM